MINNVKQAELIAGLLHNGQKAKVMFCLMAALCLLWYLPTAVQPAKAVECQTGNLCTSPECCQSICKCNGYRFGQCSKFGSTITNCMCTNDMNRWHAPPEGCKPKRRL
uniref:EB domain-containing protein n=1 Tax=Trichuris muris TaxID=70415 RepID=A0A5S6R130_TRIMR